MIRRIIYSLALSAALLAAISGGAFASAKQANSKPTKTQTCVKVAKFTKAPANMQPCQVGDNVSMYNYRTGHWSLTKGATKKAWVVEGKETKYGYCDGSETVLSYEQCVVKDAPKPISTFSPKFGRLLFTCHTAKDAVINRVLIMHPTGTKMTLKPVKHGKHSCSGVIGYDYELGGFMQVRIDSSNV
jgi:hypothetical protein